MMIITEKCYIVLTWLTIWWKVLIWIYQGSHLKIMEPFRQTSIALCLLLRPHLWHRRSPSPHTSRRRCTFPRMLARYGPKPLNLHELVKIMNWRLHICIFLVPRCLVSVSSGHSLGLDFWWASLTWIQETLNLTCNQEPKQVLRWN